MKPIILIITVLFAASCGIRSLTKKGVYQELSPESYLQYVQDSSANIIDVRTNAEYDKSHIEGAININYFGGHFKRDLVEANLDNSKPTLIYCETQHRSLFVAKKLYRKGFQNIIDLDKGMMHWRKQQFPYFDSDSIKK